MLCSTGNLYMGYISSVLLPNSKLQHFIEKENHLNDKGNKI